MRIEEHQMWGYFEWLIFKFGLLQGIAVAAGVALLGFLGCYVVAMARYGPSEGFYRVTRVIYELLARDLPGTSTRRIYALARLAFQEAIRRRVLVVMAVFIVGLLFAGWFLDPASNNIARLYISFVMTGTSYMVLLLGLFLSCFSLPADIKNKTVQTIATKPVRPTEIVLGRILGFTAVGSMLLVGMGILSYIFVVRGIVHEHSARDIAADGKSGTTTFDSAHAHTFEMVVDEDGQIRQGTTDEQKSHRHVVTVTDVDGQPRYVIGPPEGLLAARIPIFGTLQMTDRAGKLGGGLNVGYESEYQKYIEGNSLMKAIWTFDDIYPERFGDGSVLPIEMSLKAFRTFKGDIVTGVQGEIVLKSPDGRVESDRIGFIVKEYQLDHREIPRKLKGAKDGVPQEVDIWEDIVQDGKIQVEVRCIDPGQYLGMAPADLYLRAGDSTFGWNMFKGFLGIWMQMVLIICLGVMFSTFLSGPVAMVATLTCLILGFFGNLALDVATGDMPGGGPIESLIRIPMQTGAMVELDLGNPVLETTIKMVDRGIMWVLVSMFQAIPSFGQFNTADFVAYGFNIYGGLLARHLTMTVSYFVLTAVIAYFFLKTRELAAA
ncbi:MAG: ABC transporter permease [Planctomycetota bacterium]|nr:MAG: ABC transporter permease [Planctomycetota bacterium]